MVKGGYSLYAGDDTHVAECCGSLCTPAIDEANARHLAACWNACYGAPTEALENSDVLAGLSQRIAHLTIQRDELLAALNTWLEQYSAEEYKDCPEVVQTRAVIAKAADTPPTAIAPEQLEQAHKLIDEQAAKAIGGKP
jgi:hypothetical protein